MRAEETCMPPDRTYCNPLVLPNYPRGRCSYNKKDPNFKHVPGRDFRETADFSTLLMVAGVLSLGAVVSEAGLGQLLARAVAQVLPLEPGQSAAAGKVQHAFAKLGCSAEPARAAPLHSARFDLDEGCLAVGVSALLTAACAGLTP